MNIEYIWRDVLLAVEEVEWIVIAWDEYDFALEEIMKEQENIFAGFWLFLFWVLFIVVIAVDDISSDEAVIEVEGVGFDMFW